MDNDFAIYAVNTSGGLRELYQNDVSWPDQVIAQTLVNFNLLPDEDRILIWANDVGGQESISGTINGINMVDAARTSSLSVLAAAITNLPTVPFNILSEGEEPTLASVQAAFNAAIFGPAVERVGDLAEIPEPNGEIVIAQNPFALTTVGPIGRYGFNFANNGNNPSQVGTVLEQTLFLFEAADFGVSPIPEPSSFLALLISVGAFTLRRRRVNS